jgi:hypothetical protein
MTNTHVDSLDYLKKSLSLFGKKLSSYQTSVVAGVLILSDSSGDPMNSVEIYPALTEDEVKEIESSLGYTLHLEFREMLLHLNGGCFFQDLNIWGLKRMYDEGEFLEQNFDLIEDQSESRAGWEQRPWKERDLIVGDDGLGNLVVLDNDNGKVVYLDNEYPDDVKEYDSVLTYIDQYLGDYANDVIGGD